MSLRPWVIHIRQGKTPLDSLQWPYCNQKPQQYSVGWYNVEMKKQMGGSGKPELS